MKGFDTGADCSRWAARLGGDGYQFGARYLAGPSDWRYFSRREAEAMARAGLAIVSVFEVDANPAQFTAENGRKHAGLALARAMAIGQPAGSAIYFAVDTDRARLEDVIAYFTAISEAELPYRPAVYGPGAVCEALRDQHSLAAFAWLANARAWPGHAAFKDRADILQGLPVKPFPGAAFEIDPCESLAPAGFGEWRI